MIGALVLQATEGCGGGEPLRLSGRGSWVLGRARNCSLRLTGDAKVSRQHCLLELDGGCAWVQDLGSLHGTHLNGELIGRRGPDPGGDDTVTEQPRRRLRDGDLLWICNFAFVVSLEGARELTPERSGRA
jgi:eukaryotic-like serine/threonine-protein kinase